MTAFLTRRQLLQAGGLTLGALSLGRHAAGQAQKDGGTFVSARTTEATGLDPQLVPALSRISRSPMMYNQVVRFEPDMTPVPELAESWQVSSDGLQWTFKLRQGVKFHDGQELTSADVKFTFDRLFEKSPGKSDFIAVDKVEPVGKHTVKFVTKEPFAGLLAALGGFWGFIISEAGIKKHGDINKAPLGTGPFVLRPPPRPRHRADEAMAAARRAVDALLQARRRAPQEADGRGRPVGRLHGEAVRDPDVSHHGLRRAGDRRAPQAHRHHRRDRERGVRGVDQALAGQGLRPHDEHDAGLR